MHHRRRLRRAEHTSPSRHLLSLALGLLLSAWLLWPTTGYAQGNATLAEALFDQAKREYDAGNYEAACGKFSESQRLDPATGTLLNLAICYEKAGRLATAWSTWREAASSARAANQVDRTQHAREMAEQLEGRVARLTLVVEHADNLPPGFSVTQNGVPQPTAAFGVALPIDAGTYHFEASAHGYITWASDVAIQDGETLTVTVPTLVMHGAGPIDPGPQAEPEKPTVEPETTTEDDSPPSSGKGLRIAGFSVLGAGIASAGVGTYFGIRALSKNAESKDSCNSADPNVCSKVGTNDRDAALKSANIANVLIGVGAAAVTTGVVLLIVASKKKNASVALTPTPSGGHFLVSGAF